MNPIPSTPYSIARRYLGLAEIPGEKSHPFIQWCFSLCYMGFETDDDTAWCSAFCQHPFWELGLAHTGSARARSWLKVGMGIDLSLAEVGFDVVVTKRGGGAQPGAEVIHAPGHVGLYAGREGASVLILAGNQGNKVSIAHFDPALVLGVRRITE